MSQFTGLNCLTALDFANFKNVHDVSARWSRLYGGKQQQLGEAPTYLSHNNQVFLTKKWLLAHTKDIYSFNFDVVSSVVLVSSKPHGCASILVMWFPRYTLFSSFSEFFSNSFFFFNHTAETFDWSFSNLYGKSTGRFTWYDFVACDLLTTRLRHFRPRLS